jgi:Family of unknown function (DUF5706)
VTDEPRVPDAESAQSEFVEKALSAAGEWARFADPKLFGVLAFLGLGVASLVSHGHPLWDAHKQHTVWGWLATGAFVTAAALAVLTVVFATLGLFPRVDLQHGTSLFYFGGIAGYKTPDAYEAAVRAKTASQLESELANQAWEVAQIARRKHTWARRGYYAVIGFLVAWVLARVALTFVA